MNADHRQLIPALVDSTIFNCTKQAGHPRAGSRNSNKLKALGCVLVEFYFKQDLNGKAVVKNAAERQLAVLSSLLL